MALQPCGAGDPPKVTGGSRLLPTQSSEATSGVYYLSFLIILLSFIWLLFFILSRELRFP